MEYAVGSLSDLITGSTTPNKPKVIKKEIPLESVVVERKNRVKQSKHVKTETRETPLESVVAVKKNKIKQSKHVKPEAAIKTSKKRKLYDTDDTAPAPKKSKNSKNAEKRLAKKNAFKQEDEDPEILGRTIFVGNLPVTLTTKKFKKLFTKYGYIESVRIRGVAVANPKVPKKVAIIKKELHPDRKSFHGYVRFQKREDAISATEMNGTVYNDHHLRVHLCGVEDKPDESKAIFIGNLSFYAEEDDLWKLFESCGPLESVRIVRDRNTGVGKGFGYVNFKNSDSVTLAMELENVRVKDRELRISICNLNAAKKNKKNNNTRKITKPGKPKGFKGQKGETKTPAAGTEKSMEDTKLPNKKQADSNNENEAKTATGQRFKSKSFQGAKFAYKKKKNKLNKGLLQKKKMIKKVAPN